jgi:hypothetical protein
MPDLWREPLDTRQLLDQLRKERDELSATIIVLERRVGTSAPASSTRGSSVAPKPHGRMMSAADKAAMSRKLKAVWAAKRAKAGARSRAAKKAAAARKPAKKAAA